MSYDIIKGPAILRGQAVGNDVIHTKGDIKVVIEQPTMGIGTDSADQLGTRLLDVIHRISFQPSGRWSEAQSLLTSIASKQKGTKMMAPVTGTISGIADGGGGLLTLTLSAAKTVYKGQYVQITGASVAGYNGSYLVNADSTGTTVTVVGAYVSTSTGTLVIPPCLIIQPIAQWTTTEKIRIYQNAAMTALPSLTFAAGETLLGDCTITALYHPYLTPASPDALVRFATWTAPTEAMLTVDEGEIITAAPRVRWAAVSVDAFTVDDPADAPWKNFSTLNGMKVSFNLSTAPDSTDRRGTQNLTFLGLTVSAVATPVSYDPADEITDETVDLLLQHADGGLVRGASLYSGDGKQLLVQVQYGGDTMQFAITNATVARAAAAYGSNSARNGDLEWSSVRTLSAGVPAALYQLLGP